MPHTTPSVTADPAPAALIRPTLHHVTFKTSRMQEMIDWYGLVIGLEAVFTSDGGTWLTNDASNHRIALLGHPAFTDDLDRLHHNGIHHSAFEYGDLDALLSTYRRLATADVLPHVCLDHGMTLSFYYADPDGNSLELQVDNFGDWTQSTAFMHGAAFSANPIGVPVDPARLLLDREAGVDVETIHRRAYAEGAYAPDTAPDLRLPPPPG